MRFILIIITTVFLAACGEADIEGIILEIDEDQIMLAQDLSPEEYQKLDKVLDEEPQNDSVTAERDTDNLIILTYKDADEFNPGDEVKAWIEGEILASYPGQAQAKKIILKK